MIEFSLTKALEVPAKDGASPTQQQPANALKSEERPGHC